MWTAPTKGRPVPTMNTDTAFFWQGAKQRELLVQQCDSCGERRHPPGPACWTCHSLDWTAVKLNGRGRLYSYTVQYHPPAPGFSEPAVVAVIELDEGLRMVSNLVEADPAELAIGDPVEVVFVDQDEDWTAPQFRRSGR